MKCRKCKGRMTKTADDHRYRESGLENVVLKGIDIFRCDCGERVISVPRVPELNALIGETLIQKDSPWPEAKSGFSERTWVLPESICQRLWALTMPPYPDGRVTLKSPQRHTITLSDCCTLPKSLFVPREVLKVRIEGYLVYLEVTSE